MAHTLFLANVVRGVTRKVMFQFFDNVYDKQTAKHIQNAAKAMVTELSLTIYYRREGLTNLDAFPHLSNGRKEQIKNALDVKTFEININISGDRRAATIEKDGNTIYTQKDLCSHEQLISTIRLNEASIALEAIMFLHEIAGISIPYNRESLYQVVEQIDRFIQHTIGMFVNLDVINRPPEMIKSIIVFVCDLYAKENFWEIAKLLYAHMAPSDRIIYAAKIEAFIGLMRATNGINIVARIISDCVQCSKFEKNLRNILNLYYILHSQAYLVHADL